MTTTKSSISARQAFLNSLGGELNIADDEFFSQSYPAHTMTSASEIFNIWICRMIMLGNHFTDKAPFQNVFIHAVARDEKGQKMSKSLGNVIDPELLLKKYSADTLRMVLNSLIVPGRDVYMSQKSIEELIVKWRNFGNKLWNISRFIYDREIEDLNESEDLISPASGWIWEKLNRLSIDIEENLKNYRLGQVMDLIYHFVWDDLADWYIEYLKTAPNQIIFAKKHMFEPLLKLIHPFIPFESEAIWKEIRLLDTTLQKLPELLIQNQFHISNLNVDMFNLSEFESIKNFITEFRKFRGLYRIDPVTKIKVYTKNLVLKEYTDFLKMIAKIEIESQESPENIFIQEWNSMKFSFDLVKIIPDIAVEIKRTQDDLKKVNTDINKLSGLLSNSGFVSKAGEETVEKTKLDLDEKISTKEQIVIKLEWLNTQHELK